VSAKTPARSADRSGLGIALAVLAMLLFAAMDALSKLLAQGYAITQILWVRYVVFTGFALLLMRASGIRRTARSQRPLLQAARGLLLVIENGVFVLAFKHLPLADVHAIAAASPLIVIALSVPMLGEQVGWRRWLAVLAGFAGVLLIVRPGFAELSAPMLIAVAGAVMWGLYQVLVRLCARHDGSETTLFWSAAAGLVATSLIGPFEWRAPDAQGWTLLLALAAFGSLGHYALIKALSFAEAGAIQPFSYTLLLFAAFLGFLVFGDVPDRWTIAGAAVVIASGLYAWWREGVRARGGG
jgi:drug/metabolite transporter (DMT)-like permease